MGNNKEIKTEDQFYLICPKCEIRNLKGAKNCLVCGKNLDDTIVFLEDDSFDLEITKDVIIEYRKNYRKS